VPRWAIAISSMRVLGRLTSRSRTLPEAAIVPGNGPAAKWGTEFARPGLWQQCAALPDRNCDAGPASQDAFQATSSMTCRLCPMSAVNCPSAHWRQRRGQPRLSADSCTRRRDEYEDCQHYPCKQGGHIVCRTITGKLREANEAGRATCGQAVARCRPGSNLARTSSAHRFTKPTVPTIDFR